MWINRKPYKNQPKGGIPGAMQHIARKFPKGEMDVSKGGFWYFTTNGVRVMAKKVKSPLLVSYTNSSGYHSQKGTWKFVCFNANTKETIKSNLEFNEALTIIRKGL